MTKHIIFVFLLILGSTCSIQAQLNLELLAGTSLNMSVRSHYILNPNGTFGNTTINFPRGSFDLGLGARFLFVNNWSIGANLSYQYKAMESDFKEPPFAPKKTKRFFHLIVLPIDAAYFIKKKVGLHLGLELAVLLSPRSNISNKNNLIHYTEYTNELMVGGLVGLSYTVGRFRFELFYKHYFVNYMKQSFLFGNGKPNQIAEHIFYDRFHDLQLRIAFRLFSFD